MIFLTYEVTLIVVSADKISCVLLLPYVTDYTVYISAIKEKTNRLIYVRFQVVHAVGSRIPIFLDGGVRRGTNVFKALALGAQAVFVRSSYLTPSYSCH